MKEYRIITWDSNIKGEPEPWNAFIFDPEEEGQTPEDYFATYCSLLDDTGRLKIGKTENECIQKLFMHKEIKKKVGIFDKNSVFGK